MAAITATTHGLPEINESTLKLAETKHLLDEIVLTLSGFELVREGAKYKKIRMTKPTFTHEFSKELVGLVYIAVNKITGRTTFKDDDINMLCLNAGNSVLEYLGAKGFESYITDELWGISKEYCRNQERYDELVKLLEQAVKEDLKKKYSEELLTLKRFPDTLKFNETNDDFTVKHMEYLVKEENLNIEGSAAKQVLGVLLWTIMPFFEGALRKSESGLTLNYEKGIIKETIHPGMAQPDNSTSGVNGLKSALYNGGS